MDNNQPYMKIADCVTGIADLYNMNDPKLDYAAIGEWMMDNIARIHNYYTDHADFLPDPPCIHVDAVMLAPGEVDKETVKNLLNEIGNPH